MKGHFKPLDLSTLKIGDLVNYGIYSNVKYMGQDTDGTHVIMEDKSGTQEKVYTSLFVKYASKIE